MKKFKLVTLLGIRPDKIRMYKLIRLLDEGQKKYNYQHIFVQSGQHFDYELDKVFYKELKVRQPNINLNIGKILKRQGKTTQAYQSALLFEKVDELVRRIKPDAVMFLGDTNTVISSLVVAKNNIPVIHIEAGGRSYDWRMPEEKNRIIADHLSDVLYVYLPRYRDILLSESIDDFRIKVIGNIIHDPLEDFAEVIEKREILKAIGIESQKFILVTLHREENISSKEVLAWKLSDISCFAKEKKMPIVFPLMPRTIAAAEKFGLKSVIKGNGWITGKPFGFFDFSKLEKEARLIVTDSGTVQEEALILGVPCVAARRSTERPETIRAGATILEGFEGRKTLYKAMKKAFFMKTGWNRNILNPQGGSPSERVYKDLISKIREGYFKKSRNINYLKRNKFIKQAYNIK